MKKKGFTLIELLAVIVILAIIALIAVPIILNLIENSRKRAAVSSALGYVRSVNYKIVDEALFDRVVNEDEEYVIGENALDIAANNIDDITGAYTIINGRVDWAGLCVGGKYSVTYSNGSAELTGNHCGIDDYEFEEPDGIAMSEACKTDADSVYSNYTNFKLYKAEDLACFSNLTSAGKDFDGKNVYLLADIDLLDTGSYSDPYTTIYGDMNVNGTADGLLTELTTGQGFRPIGDNTTHFKGNFEGYAHTISNLMVNRPTGFSGLFGYNEGSIVGIRIRNANINAGNTNSYSRAAVLVGYNSGTVKNVDVRGNVTGTNNRVGGIMGEIGAGTLSNFVFSGNVSGPAWVGGAVGMNYVGNGTIEGVVYDTTVSVTNSDVGLASTYNGPKLVMVSASSKAYSKGNLVTNAGGTIYSEGSMLVYDKVLDTIIGGDNDSDNYYFDFDADGKIALYSTEIKETRIRTDKLKGSGTEEHPYKIKNLADLRLATATIGATPHYYELDVDIDYTNQNFYPLGTYANKFNGILDGKNHTISNLNVSGYDYAGFSGYNTGTIKNIKFVNDNVTVKTGYAGLIGVNEGTINGVYATNIAVVGEGNLGVIAGNNNNGTIKNIDAIGTVTGTSNRVGGITGSNTNGNVTDFTFKGTVTGASLIGGAVGNYYTGTVKGLVYDTTVSTINTNKVTAGTYGSYNCPVAGMTYNTTLNVPGGREWGCDAITLNNYSINAADAIIDTYIGGDNDSDGYYFDYDNGVIRMYNGTITNTLAGTGTQSDPWLIKSTDDWKVATSTLDADPHYYRLDSDLDFANTRFYQMGTNENKFNGTFLGNHKTINNITTVGYHYTGVFGYNEGTIKDLVFNNLNITNQTNYVGITGYNSGTINGIKARNLTVDAGQASNIYSFVGGITGSNVGNIKNVDVQGNLTGTGNRVGGIAGQITTGTIADFVFKGTVSGGNSIGGAVGNNETAYWSTIEGIVYDTTITCGGSLCAKAASYNGPKNVKVYNTNIIRDGNREWSYDGTEFTEITLEAVDGAVDTTINGDDDSDGYYFTLINGNYEMITAN